MTSAAVRLQMILDPADREALRLLSAEPVIVSPEFKPNATCARLIALGFVSHQYVAGGYALTLTPAGRDALGWKLH